MTDPEPQYQRITEQFSGTSPRAEIWKGFDLFLDTDAYLNLGYSPWYLPHLVGSSQKRLTEKLLQDITTYLDEASGRLLDIGCGRGGPSLQFARHRFDVLGIDLVPANINQARANATRHDSLTNVEFIVGNACRLPLRPDSYRVVTGIDSPVYVSEKSQLFHELNRVITPGGLVAVADLVAKPDLNSEARDRVRRFTDTWDFAPLISRPKYREIVLTAGLDVLRIEDISPNSTDRFRKWARMFLGLAATPARAVIDRGLSLRGIDFPVIEDQIARTAAALPYLEHVILYARPE